MLTARHDPNDSVTSIRRLAKLYCRLTVLLTVAACSSSDRATAPQSRPEFNISDAVHEGGTPGFYFLPPMVDHPTFGGTFDSTISTLNPQIALCDVTNGPDTNCGRADGTPAVIVFTTTSAPAITLDATTQHYHVNWVTKGAAFLAGHTYRVHVTAGASGARRELGFADVLLTTTPGQARNMQTGDLILLNDGSTLPIHFRIETGIPGSLTLSAPTSSVAVGNADVITSTVADLHGAVLAGATVAWTLATTPATGVADATQPLNPTSGQTSTAGTTATTFKAGTTPGTATVTAASAGLSALVSVSVSQPTPAAIAAGSPISQSAPAGTAVASPPAVIVRDGAGNPMAGVAVTFAVTSGGGTVNPATAVTTNASGIAAVTSWTLGPTAETNTLTATVGGSGIAGNPVTFTATTRGNLSVTTTTTGSSLPGGYAVSFDGPGGPGGPGGSGGSGPVATSGSTTFGGLAVGSYMVTLSGVPSNCAVTSANPQTVTVTGGATVTAAFTVSCSASAGALTVTTTTVGASPSSVATLTVSGLVSATQSVGINGSVTIQGIPAGSYTLTLSAVPATCGVASSSANPQTVTVPAMGTATATFTLQCGEVSGQGQIGTGSPSPGNNVVTFDFDVRADLTGRFTGTDYADLHGSTPATLTTDPATDPATRFTAYRTSSSACSDPTAGVEFDAIGREDTGALVSYTAYLCGGAAGSGSFFNVVIPSEGFTVSGTVTSGDILKR